MSRAHLEMASISHAAYATLRVRISNQPALRLYTESFGYVVVDIKHRYYEDGEDAFIMQCALPVVGSEGFALMSQLDATDNPKPSTAVVTESIDQSSIIASLAPLRVSS